LYKDTTNPKVRSKICHVMVLWVDKYQMRQVYPQLIPTFDAFVENLIPEPTKSLLQDLNLSVSSLKVCLVASQL
jgi:hypothetical protein